MFMPAIGQGQISRGQVPTASNTAPLIYIKHDLQ